MIRLALISGGVVVNVIDAEDDFETQAAAYLAQFDAVVPVAAAPGDPSPGSDYLGGTSFMPPKPTLPEVNDDDFTTKNEIVLPSVAGKNNYVVPVGNMFFDAESASMLEIDQGSGFVQQAFGTDYTHFKRTGQGTPETVADVAIGFSLVAAVSAGWTFRFQWIERQIASAPVAIAKVMVPPDYSLSWEANSGNAPNGVQVAPMPGMALEFWRQTFRDGGRRGSADPAKMTRAGRRFLPYFRGPVGQFSFAASEFCPAQRERRNHFRVCYYDPSGARSVLSTDIIVVCSSIQADRVNGRTQRALGSVWIE